MSVQVSNPTGNANYMDFGDVSALNSLTKFTFMARVKPTSDSSSSGDQPIMSKMNSGFNAGWTFERTSINKQLYFFAWWSNGGSGHYGGWYAPANSWLINQLNHVAVTYDAGSTGNNPLMYQNGVSKVVTRQYIPTGTWPSNAGNSLKIGAEQPALSTGLTGIISDSRIYNRILSASEILAECNLGNNPSAINLNGLVFYAPLNMANGLTIANFAGTTLAAGNTFRDNVGCAVGTPVGSPVGA